MAAWRKIHRDLATSERFHRLTERARLAYCQAYPFTDREGRLPRSARKLLGTAFPMAGWSVEEVEDIIRQLSGGGLWELAADSGGVEFIQVVRFFEYQGRHHVSKEIESRYGDPAEVRQPAPPEPAGSRQPRPPQSREEEIRVEERRVPDAPPLDRPAVSGAQKQEAAAICDQVRDAFREALGSPHWPMTPKRVAKMAPYSGLLSGHPNLVAGFRVAIPAVRATGADETWLFENVLEYLSTNPRAGTTSAVALTGAPGHVPNTPTPDWVLEARAAGWTG